MNISFQVTHGMRGWFAVMLDKNTGEPLHTGIGSYATSEEAAIEAAEWAEAEGFTAEAERLKKEYNLI